MGRENRGYGLRVVNDMVYLAWCIACRFRAIGNVVGLCLLHGSDTIRLRLPLYFCRHVYKVPRRPFRHHPCRGIQDSGSEERNMHSDELCPCNACL